MSNKTKNEPVVSPQPTLPKREHRGRVPLVILNAATALLLTACATDRGTDDGDRVFTPAPAAPSSTSEAAPSATTTPNASPVTEAAPDAVLQAAMTERATEAAGELSQSILSLAATLPPEFAPTEPAGDDGSMLQYARVDVPAEDGTSTHYEFYTQFTDPGAGLPPVISNVNIEVDIKDAAGAITDTPYWLTVARNPQGTGQMVALMGAGEGGLFAVSDDFSGAAGLNPGDRPILNLADENAVFEQAQRVIEDAGNGVYSHGQSAPF